MPPSDPNNTYTKPPSEIQFFEFIKTLGYDEDPEIKMIAISKMVATRLHQPWRVILSVLNRCLTGKDLSWGTVRLQILQILWGIVHSANLDFASLIWDEFEWKIVERSSRPSKMSKILYTRFTNIIIDYILSHNKSIPRKLDSKLHKEQYVSPVQSGRGKGFMCYADQVVNAPNKLKKDVVPRKTRSLTIAKEMIVGELAHSISIKESRSQQCRRSQSTIDSQTDEAVADMYNGWGQKLNGLIVNDPTFQSLLDLRKGSKASRIESLRQKKKPVAREGSSVAHKKYYASSDTNSDATLYSSSSDESKESANETDDADKPDMDLFDDNLNRDYDVARNGVFMHNKSTTTPNSTYLSLTCVRNSELLLLMLIYYCWFRVDAAAKD
ncbi:hypothetical protein Tco_1294557 [Tanacetum coccineum]